MANLTENREAILREMAKGKAIKEYTGHGREGAYTFLVDPPYRVPGTTKITKGDTRRVVKYSDFEALAFDLKYIIQYYTDYPDVYYEITPTGKAALEMGSKK